MNKAHALVIGGGHNGLVCACYLARSGLKVRVLERRSVVGGARSKDCICAAPAPIREVQSPASRDIVQRGRSSVTGAGVKTEI